MVDFGIQQFLFIIDSEIEALTFTLAAAREFLDISGVFCLLVGLF